MQRVDNLVDCTEYNPFVIHFRSIVRHGHTDTVLYSLWVQILEYPIDERTEAIASLMSESVSFRNNDDILSESAHLFRVGKVYPLQKDQI